MVKSVLQLTQTPEFKLRLKEQFLKIDGERRRLGLPKAAVIDGAVFRQFPDGRLEPVEPQETGAGAKKPDAR